MVRVSSSVDFLKEVMFELAGDHQTKAFLSLSLYKFKNYKLTS